MTIFYLCPEIQTMEQEVKIVYLTKKQRQILKCKDICSQRKNKLAKEK